jgi:hypothetical protein
MHGNISETCPVVGFGIGGVSKSAVINSML